VKGPHSRTLTFTSLSLSSSFTYTYTRAHRYRNYNHKFLQLYCSSSIFASSRLNSNMPYILIHPLPPPRRNPYAPELPTFTTSSRSIAHFFHSHGWRAHHVYADLFPSISAFNTPPSLTSSRSSSTCSIRSNCSIGSNDYISASSLSSHHYAPEHELTKCCLNSTGSSILSCGPVVELHSYLIPLNPAIFHGPPATAMQVRYFRWYAHPHVNFDAPGGGVDLHLPNLSALAQQKETDEDFWRGERRAERRRRRKEREARDKVWDEFHKMVAQGGKVEAELQTNGNIVPGSVVMSEKREEVDKYLQLISADQDEDIDEELGKQWWTYERALLASEGLE
jgi:hypothetical protein